MATPSVWVHLLKLESKNVFVSKYKSLQIPTLLKSSHSTTERKVLMDSGATDNFICSKLLKCLKIGKLKLKNPRTIWNINGTHNKSGTINKCVNLLVQVGDRRQEMRFLITDLGEDEIVLGYPWLATFQPHIDWKNATLAEEISPWLSEPWTLPWTKKSHAYARHGYATQKIWQNQEKRSTSESWM